MNKYENITYSKAPVCFFTADFFRDETGLSRGKLVIISGSVAFFSLLLEVREKESKRLASMSSRSVGFFRPPDTL